MCGVWWKVCKFWRMVGMNLKVSDHVKWGCPVKRVTNDVSASGAKGFQFNDKEAEKQGSVESGKKKAYTRVYSKGKENAKACGNTKTVQVSKMGEAA